MTLSESDRNQLILDIHASTFESERWSRILGSVARVANADSAIMLAVGVVNAHLGPSPVFNIDPSWLEAYGQHYYQHDLWVTQRTDAALTGGFVVSEAVVAASTLKRSVFFNEFLRPQRIQHGLFVLTRDTATRGIVLSLYRGGPRGEFGEHETAQIGGLIPHLDLAARNAWYAHALGLRADTAFHALERLSLPVFHVTTARRVECANSAAMSLVRRGDWISLAGDSVRYAGPVRSQLDFATVLSNLLAGLGSEVLLENRRTKRRAILVATPSPDHDGASGYLWFVESSNEGGAARVLARIFGLTRAEERLFEKLIESRDLNAASAELDISPHTARNQLKAIFEKAGVRRQSELIGLAARLAAVAPRE